MAKDNNAAQGFVCVHNRNRDNYEVALALEEAGLLKTLVTDLYCPDWMPAWLRGPLAKRRREGLSSSQVRNHLISAVVQYGGALLGRPMEALFARSDKMLARFAAKLARQQHSGLYAYASYFDGLPRLEPGRPIVVFEYHPHPKLALEILASDLEIYPRVAWSFDREREVAATESLLESWRFADAVVCASSMTRRTLIHAGCPEERIAVIPYGSSPPTAALKDRPDGPCQFLFVGQGIQRKGLHHLAEAWRISALSDCRLTVVSYVIDPGIAEMLDLPGVTLLGHQSRASLDALFAKADTFVMPSLVEGFGLVYLEALAAGCHVLGTHNTGLPDMHLSEVAATIVPPGEPEVLAAALVSIAERKLSRELNPTAIRAEGARWGWGDFRQKIAAHAAQVKCLAANA
jgi:glycosyltransferase involved in cell wall biosynthesis